MDLSDEWAHQTIQWSNNIRSAPTFDAAALKNIANGLRKVAKQLVSDQNWDYSGTERLAMDFVAESIRYGAFSGADWITWRTRLSNRPHIGNAAAFLECPPAPYEPPLLRSSVKEATADAAIVMADLIDFFAQKGEDPENSQPNKRKPRGRRKGSYASDPREDARLYNNWKASGSKIADFSRDSGLVESDVRSAIDRHKHRRSGGKN